MPKKKIHKLPLELDNSFHIIGIASHENDYRLSWAINNFISLELKKTEDIIINHPKHKVEINYSIYQFNDEMDYIDYHLISNKSEKGFLISEMKNIDFILRLSGNPDMNRVNEIVTRLKKIDIVITAFLIDDLPDKIRKALQF